MTRRVSKLIFFNRDVLKNDYVSEFFIWTRTRACCTPSCRYTRCLRCSCWSGPRDFKLWLNFNHVSEVASLHVASRVSTWNFLQIWTDLYHRHLYQSKTGVRTLLTSQIKELDSILQKLIKLWTWNTSGRKMRQWDGFGVDGDADRLLQLLRAVGDVRLGANESAKRKRKQCSFTRTRKMRK